jgi:hypothetical protein
MNESENDFMENLYDYGLLMFKSLIIFLSKSFKLKFFFLTLCQLIATSNVNPKLIIP